LQRFSRRKKVFGENFFGEVHTDRPNVPEFKIKIAKIFFSNRQKERNQCPNVPELKINKAKIFFFPIDRKKEINVPISPTRKKKDSENLFFPIERKKEINVPMSRSLK
jgi:hypothetical protein